MRNHTLFAQCWLNTQLQVNFAHSTPPLPLPTCGSRPADPSAARRAPGCLCPPLPLPVPLLSPPPPDLQFSSSRSLSCPYSSRLSMPPSPSPRPPPPPSSLPAVLVLQIHQLPVQFPVVYAPLSPSPSPSSPPLLPTCGSRPPDPSAARTAPGCLCPPPLPPLPPPSPPPPSPPSPYLRFSSSRSLSCPYSSRLSMPPSPPPSPSPLPFLLAVLVLQIPQLPVQLPVVVPLRVLLATQRVERRHSRRRLRRVLTNHGEVEAELCGQNALISTSSPHALTTDPHAGRLQIFFSVQT